MNLLNGIHFLYPRIPGLGGSRHNIGRLFQTKPLNAIGSLSIGIYLFVIGMTFFIPLDLSFSIWFFYLFHKLTCIWGVILGIGQLPDFPFREAQSFGGWMVIGVAAVWTTRKFLLAQLRRALQAARSEDEDTRMVRAALVGLALGWTKSASKEKDGWKGGDFCGSSGLSGEAVRIGTGMSRLSSRKLAKPPIGGTFLSRS